jgi:hypothetical protein
VDEFAPTGALAPLGGTASWRGGSAVRGRCELL